MLRRDWELLVVMFYAHTTAPVAAVESPATITTPRHHLPITSVTLTVRPRVLNTKEAFVFCWCFAALQGVVFWGGLAYVTLHETFFLLAVKESIGLQSEEIPS